jgi:hypothetical protein
MLAEVLALAALMGAARGPLPPLHAARILVARAPREM